MGQANLLERARSYIYHNGRLLDRKRYEYWFENGSKEAVLKVLQAYQNEDGGFGNALEPDIRCPSSQPVTTEMALFIMDELGQFDQNILKGIVRYLKNITLEDGGFPLAHLNIIEYPHAPWWKIKRDDIPSINPTGNIIGLLLKQKEWTDFMNDDWFLKSAEFIWRTLDQEKPSGYHDGIQWITFLQHTPDRSRASKFLPILDQYLAQPGLIERNANADGYVHKVLDWAPAPDSYASQFITTHELDEHLNHVITKQQDDGGWPISWPAVSPAGEQEWRGWVTVERLKTLQAYGRL